MDQFCSGKHGRCVNLAICDTDLSNSRTRGTLKKQEMFNYNYVNTLKTGEKSLTRPSTLGTD